MVFIGYEYTNDQVKWKKIYWMNGEETKYSISNIGLVRNDKKDKILKTREYKGYLRVGLTHNGKQKEFLIHRLVAIAFIPNPENKPEVNHINGVKSCNYDYNLEWVTRTENQIHAVKNGLIDYKNNKNGKNISEEKIQKICKLLEENKLTEVQIAKKIGCSRQVVYYILKKRSHQNISKDYNIDNYEVKKDFSKKGDDNERMKYPDKMVIKICEMIDSHKYTLPEIGNITDVPYQTIRNIYYGSCRRSITKNYNFMKEKGNVLMNNKKELIRKVCELLDTGLNTREVSEKIGISRSVVRKVFSGQTWYGISKDYDFMKKKKKNKW